MGTRGRCTGGIVLLISFRPFKLDVIQEEQLGELTYPSQAGEFRWARSCS
jgi:hypothetical protein